VTILSETVRSEKQATSLPLRGCGLPRVVIIGGGFGGLNAARALKRAPVDVVLIDRQNHHVFQPLLYQVATAGLSPGDIASPIRHILRRQKNVQVLLGEARSIDVEAKKVVLDIGVVPYDALIVAAGATHSYFGHDEWRKVAPGLKTLHDALEIREKILLAFERAERTADERLRSRLLTFVIVGAGPTGVELAGTLAEIARHTLKHEFRAIAPETARIILLEGAPTLLSTFPPRLRKNAEDALRELGVDVRLGTMVTGLEPGRVRIGEETIEAETILWAAGVMGSSLGQSLGAPTDRAGRVKVRSDLTVPGREDVYVVGDLAAFEEDGKLLPGVAQVAMQQATCAARNVVRTLRGEPRREFTYRNWGNLATIGRARAVADLGRLEFGGYVAWLFWLFIHILQLVGFRNRLTVLLQWSFAYTTYQRDIRLIT
jgi:NADH:ubiquinone reductase (H+-translocating)